MYSLYLMWYFFAFIWYIKYIKEKTKMQTTYIKIDYDKLEQEIKEIEKVSYISKASSRYVNTYIAIEEAIEMVENAIKDLLPAGIGSTLRVVAYTDPTTQLPLYDYYADGVDGCIVSLLAI